MASRGKHSKKKGVEGGGAEPIGAAAADGVALPLPRARRGLRLGEEPDLLPDDCNGPGFYAVPTRFIEPESEDDDGLDKIFGFLGSM
jgi:hypothetical protein